MNSQAQRVRDIFVAAVKLTPERWEAFLKEACADDDEVRRQVSGLLWEDQQAGSCLDRRDDPMSPQLLHRVCATVRAHRVTPPASARRVSPPAPDPGGDGGAVVHALALHDLSAAGEMKDAVIVAGVMPAHLVRRSLYHML